MLLRPTSQKLIIYYTDSHDVDEDSMTIPVQGAIWTDNIYAGIVCRNIHRSPSDTYYYAASSTVEIFDIIRIFMMSTKI